jgi:hypothetical protein
MRAVFDTIRNNFRALEDPDISESHEHESNALLAIENATRLLMKQIDDTAIVRIQVRDYRGNWEWFEDSYFGAYEARVTCRTVESARLFMGRVNDSIRAGYYESSSKPYAPEEIRYVRTATIHEVIG